MNITPPKRRGFFMCVIIASTKRNLALKKRIVDYFNKNCILYVWGRSKGMMIPNNVVVRIYYRDPIKVALRMKAREIEK
jgi:hypothetical protein